MRQLRVLIVLCLTLGSAPLLPEALAQAALEQRIAAVVNERVVTVRDLNERLELVLLTSGIDDSEQARSRLAPQVLRGLIEETLQLQEADRLGVTVDDAEVQRALANIAERNNMSVDDMRGFLQANGVNLDTLLRQVRAQIAWVKVVNREIRPRVTVTVDQLALAMQETRQNQGQPEYLLSEIVLPVDSPAQAERVSADAQRLVQTLRDGASFPSLARQVSVAASAEQGGELGWVPSSSVPDELLGALEALQPGEVSDPIGSPIGYHVFWLRDRRVARARVGPSAAEVEVELTQILFPADGAGSEILVGLREQAAALREDLADCAAMVETAEELGAPSSGDLGRIRIGDMPADLARAVLALPVGEVSQPLRSPAGIHLLMVCDREEPESLASREEVAQRLEEEQLDRLARRHLRDLRKEAFVEVRL